MLELDELKELHDKAYERGQVPREQASDDLVFYWVTQWDDNLLGDSTLAYRGQFDMLRKAGRQIIADLRANPIQIDFEPRDASRDDAADLIDGLYRSDDRVNRTLEAYDNASGESVVCGIGGWELHTEYETNRAGDRNQVIRRKPLYEFNNKVFFDPNAKLLDKSDAMYCSVLEQFSPDAYEAEVERLTGEKPEGNWKASFAEPEQSYSFPWVSGESEKLYIVSFYHREQVKDKILYMSNPMGAPINLRESDLLERDLMDELLDEGYTIDDSKEITRWQVTKYIASGAEILDASPIAGEHIPVVPTYGERSFIEGEEHYEGITRLAKDPQRLRNFQLSYLADIVSRSPRPKPIFTPEQIGQFRFMYEEAGAENNYPYILQESKDAQGQPVPLGPVGMMPEQPMPTALAQSIDLSRQAIEDVANPGLPQDIADPDLSGKAVMALQNRLDQQSMVYQQNLKHAKRRDAEIYASMAADVYDAPRHVTLTLPDGTRKKAEVMEMVVDKETGEPNILNDVTNMEWDVYADIGPSYASQKEQTMEQLGSMAAAVAATDPGMQKMLILKQMTMMDGVNFDDARAYARKQLVLSGFAEPETEEEEALVVQSQQSQQPDANMLLAQAEMMKGQAQQMREQREMMKDQANIQNNQAQTQIDVFKAQTDRMNTQIDAQEAGATIDYKRVQQVGQQIDNSMKAMQARQGQIQSLSNEELLRMARGER